MKAFAVINPILEAIKYFYLKANNTCIRQKIDNIIRNREVTAEQAEAIMHPAMVLERFLDENIVMPSCAEELFGDIPCIEGADSLNTCIAALLTDRALRSEIRNIDEAEQLLLSQTQPQAISNITMNLTSPIPTTACFPCWRVCRSQTILGGRSFSFFNTMSNMCA